MGSSFNRDRAEMIDSAKTIGIEPDGDIFKVEEENENNDQDGTTVIHNKVY